MQRLMLILLRLTQSSARQTTQHRLNNFFLGFQPFFFSFLGLQRKNPIIWKCHQEKFAEHFRVHVSLSLCEPRLREQTQSEKSSVRQTNKKI